MENILKKVKKNTRQRPGWTVVGISLLIVGFTSFSNHPDWGVWVSVLGFAILIAITLFRLPRT